MSFFDALRYRFRVLGRSRDHERELAEEVDFHLGLESMQRAHRAGGKLSSRDARFAARRRFGNRTHYLEESREVAGLWFLDVLRQDVRFAVRTFLRTPTFTIVAILTLALGIGANTAIFSAVDALLLRPLPFSDPDRLMAVSLTVPPRGQRPGSDDRAWSYPKFTVFRQTQSVFSDATLWTSSQFTLRASDEATRVQGEYTDAHYLTTLGIRTLIGRNFLPEEDIGPAASVGGPRVALLSHQLWLSMFNADSSVIGRSVDVDGKPYTVIGVVAPPFRGLSGDALFWMPIASMPADWGVASPRSHSFFAVARRAPGVSAERAAAMVREIGKRVDAVYPEPGANDFHWGAMARPMDAARVDSRVRRTILILFGAVGLILLIACANVANLFLVRASSRRREMAVRLAIGAGRGRLIRQLLVESILLSLAGAVASLMVAWTGVRALSTLELANLLRLENVAGLGAVSSQMIRLDPKALAFTGLLAIATGIVFGLVPALAATRPSLTDALKDGGTGHQSARRWFSGRNALVVIEMALAVVLLAGSGLMLRSLNHLLGVHPGFDASHVLTMRVNRAPAWARDSISRFYDVGLQRLASLAGVAGVAMSDCPPLNSCAGAPIIFHDRPPVPPGTEPGVGVHWITPDWAAVLRVPLLRGRLLTMADRIGTQRVILVNETAARMYWPGRDPIGTPVSIGGKDTVYVVGVVGDVRYDSMDLPARPDAYISYYQAPLSFRMMFFIRTTGDPAAIAASARTALHEVAPGFPVYDARTLESRVNLANLYARFSALILSLFAATALGLAMMGTYGVISFAVSQRTQEISVRVALGATAADLVRMVIRQGIALAIVGAGAGLAVALVVTRVLGSLLYDVVPTDPPTLATIVVLLLLAVVAASWIPARRAAGIPAVQALRGG